MMRAFEINIWMTFPKIAQPFMAGKLVNQHFQVPTGTKEVFCRPHGTFFIFTT
jgi:hypothetical protein